MKDLRNQVEKIDDITLDLVSTTNPGGAIVGDTLIKAGGELLNIHIALDTAQTAILALTTQAYEQGKRDEAKICEQAKRHQLKQEGESTK